MPQRSPARASVFGALDTDAIADGYPLSAHVLRTLVQGANRIATRPEPLLTLAWDSSTDGAEANVHGLRAGYLHWSDWTMVVPGPLRVPKPRNVDKMDVRMLIHIGGAGPPSSPDQVAHVRVDTNATEFIDPADLSAPNVKSFTPSGETLGSDPPNVAANVLGWAMLEIDNVPCTRGLDHELISVAVKGSNTLTPVSVNYTVSGLGAVSGPIGELHMGRGFMTDTGATWNLAGTVLGDDAAHALVFTDPSTGQNMTDPLEIVGPISAETVVFSPRLPDNDLHKRIEGRPANWAIYNLNTFRIASITCYSSLVDL